MEILVSFVVKGPDGSWQPDSRIVKPRAALDSTTLLMLEQQIQATETGEVRVIGYTKLERQLTGSEVLALVRAIKEEIPDIDSDKLLGALEIWAAA